MPDFWKTGDSQMLNYAIFFLAGQRLESDQEAQEVQSWRKGLAAICIDEGIQKLVPRYWKCLNIYDNNVDKYINVGTHT